MHITEQKDKKVKILCVTHKSCELPKLDFLVPIHAGRAVATEVSKDGVISNKTLNWLLKNTIGDDTGENISLRNRFYNETSAMYWAWKNYEELGNPDYIGLMHYRRHFVFNDEYYHKKWTKGSDFDKAMSTISECFINEKYLEKIGLNNTRLQNLIKNYDLVVSYPSQFNLLDLSKTISIREDYDKNIPHVKVEDFDLMIDLIKNKYPQYSNNIDNYINGSSKYMFQMFIMKKELFFEYCEFLFEILFEIEKKVDFSKYEIYGVRSLGYLAEIMLTIFLITRGSERNIKKIERGITIVKYPETKEELDEKYKNLKYDCFKYLYYKIRYLFTINKSEKERLKIKYKNYKNNNNFIKDYNRNFR